MRSNLVGAVGLIAISWTGQTLALPPAAQRTDGRVLPLHSVRLFENGVGYFERQGVIRDPRGAVLPLPASHVDDAMKTLVVLSGEHATVQGLELSSVVPEGTARALAGLPADAEKPLEFENLLASLKGYSVEVQSKLGNFRGRLLDVEPIATESAKDSAQPETEGEPPSASKQAPPRERVFALVFTTEQGGLKRVLTSDLLGLRPLDAGFASRLDTAVNALSGRAAQLPRELRVQATGTAPVRIGYVAETPVWRTSYRLVLESGSKKGKLQGWALVHNDTDEAWQELHVELVNGRPDSFLFPLAAPRYARRALLTPEEQLSTVPQLARKTPDAIWGDNDEDDFGSGGIGLSGIGEGGGGQGFGVGHGRLGGSHATMKSREGMSSEISVGDLAAVTEAEARDEGMLFSYALAAPLSLRAHGSALVPFLSKDLDAQRLTWFDGPGEEGRATVLITNRSANTLPAGPLAVFEPSGYSGEALLERMPPAGRAFLEYGTDLDTSLGVTNAEVGHDVELVRWDGNVLVEHFIERSERTLTIDNRSNSPRTIAYALRNVVNNAAVEGADSLDYEHDAHVAVAMVTVKERSQLSRTLKLREGKRMTYTLDQLTPELLERFAQSSHPTPAHADGKDLLKRAEALLRKSALHRAEAVRLREVEKRLLADLERHQAYLSARVHQGADDPLAKRVVELEQALTRTRASIEAQDIRATELTSETRALIEKLS